MSVPEEAATAVVEKRLLDGYCLHDRRCVCRSKLRMSAWATLDALLRSGWTLTPPNAQEG